MSTHTIAGTNRLVADTKKIIDWAETPGALNSLRETRVNWNTLEATGFTVELEQILRSCSLATGSHERITLTQKGVYLLGKLMLNIEELAKHNAIIAGKYRITQTIASGRYSVTFKATHTVLMRTFALKVLRPGTSPGAEEALGAMGKLSDCPQLVQPIDYFTFEKLAVNGELVTLRCLVFPYIEGETLDEFLARQPPISPFFVVSFIAQIAGALKILEAAGMQHGDLHSGNILVTQQANSPQLHLIDLSHGLTQPSDYEYDCNDFVHFQEHLWRTLRMLQGHLPRISLRKHLGARNHLLVQEILSAQMMTFEQIVSLLHRNTIFEDFQERRRAFLSEKFPRPHDMALLRYEEITDPAVAIELFTPYAPLMQEVRAFGNALIYGHRGSGKSTYLAALAFFPQIEKPMVDFRRAFGIFFACRQGEFKQFSENELRFDLSTISNIKHILVHKIIRRTLDAISAAVSHDKIAPPDDLDQIRGFLANFLPVGSLLDYEQTITSPLDNLNAALLRNELVEIDRLFSTQPVPRAQSATLNERDLVEFCRMIRTTFRDLSEAQFFFIFDDVGTPNMSKDLQKVLNDVIRCINPIYCVKVSAERFSYNFQDTAGKALEEPHDYSQFDISATLSLGSGFTPERGELEQYFHAILARRLSSWHYPSDDIRAYLGELPDVGGFIRSLARAERTAYYHGWNVVWQLSDRTSRHLLELVSSILSAGNVSAGKPPKIIEPRIQHRAIKAYSEKKLKSLKFTAGTATIRGETVALGTKLFEFTSILGNICRTYLQRHSKQDRRDGTRLDERLALERNDMEQLSPDADAFLTLLIRFAVLDDSKLEQAFDDNVRKPLYILNRIFCPAFRISFRRDQHIRLSREKLEELLLSPQKFSRVGTKFLQSQADDRLTQGVLFEMGKK